METILASVDRGTPLRNALSILVSHGAPILLGAGVALALRVGPHLGPEFVPGPVTTWVADRDADAVIGLDDGLFEALRIELESPVELELRSDGRVWVLSARESHPLGPHDLVLFGADGRRDAGFVLGPALDLDLVGDDALVVERKGSSGRVVRVDAAGTGATVLALDTAVCAAGYGERIAVGTEAGEVWLLDAAARPPTVLGVRKLGGPIGDLAFGPTPGTWWALDVGGNARLSLLEATLVPRWTVPIGVHALHLAPQRGRERVWIADTTAPLARRFGAGGALELDVQALPLAGLDRAEALNDGGVLLAAPGAVLHLDGSGALLPGQGGFDFLVDLTR